MHSECPEVQSESAKVDESVEVLKGPKAEPLAEPRKAPAAGESPEKFKHAGPDFIERMKKLGFRVFKTADGNPWATFEVITNKGTKIRRVVQLESTELKNYVRNVHHKYRDKLDGDAQVDQLIGLLAYEADYTEDVEPVFIRVAHDGLRRYLDLGRMDGKVVEVDPNGWWIKDCPPTVNFLRTKGVGPLGFLPDSTATRADVDLLWKSVNVSPEDRPLYVGFLLASFLTDGGLPIALFLGPHGSGKSFAARTLKQVFDPSGDKGRVPSRTQEALAVAARGNWIISFDNLSKLPDWLSDNLAALATETSFSRRGLYSNFDEVLFSAKRPIVINGIPEALVNRADLVSRCYTFRTPEMTAKKTEAFLNAQLKADLPKILGGLLYMVRDGLKSMADETPVDPPQTRLADAAVWAEHCRLLPPGEYTNLVKAREDEGALGILEDWPLGNAIIELTKAAHDAGEDAFEITPKTFLEFLQQETKFENLYKQGQWPNYKTAGNQLDRGVHTLAAAGVKAIKHPRNTMKGRPWKFVWTGNSSC